MHRTQSLSMLARATRSSARLSRATTRPLQYTTPFRPALATPSTCLSSGHRFWASTVSAPAAASEKPVRTERTPTPEMRTSLDQLVPKSLFETPANATEAVEEPVARRIVEVVLQQMRTAIDAPTLDKVNALQRAANEEVRRVLEAASLSASSLHQLATKMLRVSKDPRKTPIAFRLFGIAFGMDPAELEDPTASAPLSAADGSLASVPVAGKGAWGINAAGYSWASMVLSGQSPPPPGIHLLPNGSKEYIAAIARQQAAAVRVYATLAMRGDAQGMLGMGRVLMAGTQREVPVPGKTGKESEEEVKVMRDRAVALWTKAGQLGVGDAWFELGLLSLGTTKGVEVDEDKSRGYFELGAKQGNFRSHHALGVMHTQAAMADNRSPSPPERNEHLAKSLGHFTAAAELGDPQSAHNVGLRYLLRDEMVEEVGTGMEEDGRTKEDVVKQAGQRHASLWGVEADDGEARKWFARAADLGSVPAMMNYAGMLVEARGSPSPAVRGAEVTSQEDAARVLIHSRIEDLQKAESLYSRVAAHGSVMAQQQPSASEKGGADQESRQKEPNVGQEMADFAQEALGTVQLMMKQLLDEANKLPATKTT